MPSKLLRYDEEKVLTFIDVETENLCLSFINNRPWQVSTIQVKGNNIIKETDKFVYWDDLNVSEGAAVVTRFDINSYKKRAEPQNDVFNIIYDQLVNSDYIIGHNVLGFDIYLLRDWHKFNGKDWHYILPKMIDTNLLAKGVKFGVPYKSGEDLISYQYTMYHTRQKGVKTNLKAMADEFGLEFDENRLHDSLYDLKINIGVWNKLKYLCEI